MNHIPFIVIINLVIILSLNAKPNFYLIETAEEHNKSLNTYAEKDGSEHINPLEISIETDNSSEIISPNIYAEEDGSENINPSEISIETDNSSEIISKKNKMRSAKVSEDFESNREKESITPDATDVLSKDAEAYIKEIEKNNPGFHLIEGDMILNRNQQKTFGEYSSNADYEADQALIAAQWPNNIMYYIFDKTVNKGFRKRIRSAIAELREKLVGCVEIVEGVGENYVIVSAKRNFQCLSMVGVNRWSKNSLNLDERKCSNKGLIQHEFIHSLGIYHHQARKDRDKYVKINWENIITKPKNQKHNFRKQIHSKTYNLPYDYKSVMHYGGSFFSKRKYGPNKVLTIETRNPKYQNVIGRQNHISDGDIKLIKAYYGCKKDIKGLTPYILKSSGGAKSKYPQLMGIYSITQDIHNSFPVYKQKGGHGFTYVDSTGNWVVGKNTLNGYPKLYSRERPVLSTPAATRWFYVLNNKWRRDTNLTMVPSN